MDKRVEIIRKLENKNKEEILKELKKNFEEEDKEEPGGTMKLSELVKNRKFHFKSKTDEKFYNKYANKECVVAYVKKDTDIFERIYVVIKVEREMYALCFDYWFLHFYNLSTLHKNIKGKKLVIVGKKEYGNVQKQMIVEALEQGNK